MASNAGLGLLGFLAGLTQAVERINERNRSEQLSLLELGAKSGKFEIAPAASPRPASALARLLGGSIYAPGPEGQPVIPFGGAGGSAITLRPLPLAAQLPPEVLKTLGLQSPEAQQFIGQIPAAQLIPAFLKIRQKQFEEEEETKRQERLNAIFLGEGEPAATGATSAAAPLGEAPAPGVAALPTPTAAAGVAATPAAAVGLPTPVERPLTPAEEDATNKRLVELDRELTKVNGILKRTTGMGGEEARGRITDLQTRANALQKEKEHLVTQQDKRLKVDFGYGDITDREIVRLFGTQLARPGGGYNPPTPEMVDRAAAAIEQRELVRSQQQGRAGAEELARKAFATTMARLEAEQKHEASQPIGVAKGEKGVNYVYRVGPKAGKSAIKETMGVLQTEMGKGITVVSDKQLEELAASQRIAPLIDSIGEKLERLYGPGGLLADVKPGVLNRLLKGGEAGYARLAQTHPEAVTILRQIEANVDDVGRVTSSVVGTQTERDATRNLKRFAATGGALPDTPEVAFDLYNSLVRTVNSRGREFLDNPDYKILEERSPKRAQAAPEGIREAPISDLLPPRKK